MFPEGRGGPTFKILIWGFPGVSPKTKKKVHMQPPFINECLCLDPAFLIDL